MKNSQLKSAFADSILTIAPLSESWECFSEMFNHANPRQAILDTNRGCFPGDIYDARPILTPSEDFFPVLSKFELAGKHYKLDVDRFIFDGDYPHPDSEEFFRLVIIHTLVSPDTRCKPKFLIFNTCSEPKQFIRGKKYKLRVPVPLYHLNDVDSYKHQCIHAFFMHLLPECEVNANGSISYHEIALGYSPSDSLNVMRLDDSDMYKILPPNF